MANKVVTDWDIYFPTLKGVTCAPFASGFQEAIDAGFRYVSIDFTYAGLHIFETTGPDSGVAAKDPARYRELAIARANEESGEVIWDPGFEYRGTRLAPMTPSPNNDPAGNLQPRP